MGATLEELPGRLGDLGGLPIRRLLPRRARRLVGPWCFLDSFGPARFASGKAMDVAPHPHIGLQTVSWLLEGEVLHHDSLGLDGLAREGVVNLMTAGRGIAHAEETPPVSSGRLRGVQLWIALPSGSREVAPDFLSFEAPRLELPGVRVTVLAGEMGGVRARGRVFSPLVGADVATAAGPPAALPLEPAFEHALVPLAGDVRLGDRALEVDALYYLGAGRREVVLTSEGPSRVLLLGGEPLGETVLMWWNFVARTSDEIEEARADWEAGRRFGEVAAYPGTRLSAPPFVVSRRPD